MAGHSKWANIRFRKGAQDAKRGKIFTKLIREITVATRMGGADESANPRLRDAINKALKANMKRDTIESAIKRGAGGGDGADMMEMRYEGYGPNGVAILVDCLSDNKNRTVSEVRHAFTKYGGNLGTDGSVAYLFTKQGQILLSSDNDEEKVFELALEAGADDVKHEQEGYEIITTPETYHEVVQAFENEEISVEDSSIAMQASTLVPLDLEGAQKLMRLIDMLEDLDDVQNVYSNADIPKEIMEQLD
jgi:YebC/PmpR family DNA-binding regulatory protein